MLSLWPVMVKDLVLPALEDIWDLLLSEHLVVLKLFDDWVVHLIAFVFEPELLPLLEILTSLLRLAFAFFLDLELFFYDLAINLLLPFFNLHFDLLHGLDSFFFGLSVELLGECLFAVGIARERNVVKWCSECLPVDLTKLVQTLKVVLDKGLVALRHYFHVMGLLRVVSGSEQEDEPFSLQGS